MKRVIGIVFTAITLIVISCEKDEINAIKCYPISEGSIKYEYDTRYNLVKEIYSEDYYDSNTYNDGKLVKVTTVTTPAKVIYYRTYEYNIDGSLSKISYYYYSDILDSAILQSYNIYTANEKGDFVKCETFNSDNKSDDNYIIYEFDKRGNISKLKKYSDNNILFRIDYKYDNKNSPHKLLGHTFENYQYGVNNLLKSVQTNYNNIDNPIETNIYKYNYNSYGFPVSCTVNQIGIGFSGPITIEYLIANK